MCLAKPLPEVNQDKCTLCGLCVEACQCHAIEMGEQGPVFRPIETCSAQCNEGSPCVCFCEEVCPTGAISCCYEIVLDDSEQAAGAEPSIPQSGQR